MPVKPSPVEVNHLTKRFGRGGTGVLAVDDLTFTVAPGRITGFLGPNGAGKTTTLRCLVGLVRPTSGTATIGGQSYGQLQHATTVVGAALEASGFHPARTARQILRIRAAAVGLPDDSIDSMLGFVGLADARDRKAGQFSLGMKQRLALALALLPDPSVLILDEPANGLDPAGIAWLRQFLRGLADEGRTILVSSHLLAEVRQTVDDVVILDEGRLVAAGPLAQVVGDEVTVVADTPNPEALTAALTEAGGTATSVGTRLTIAGLTGAQVGHLAFVAGIELHELHEEHVELEQVFLRLTTKRPTGEQS